MNILLLGGISEARQLALDLHQAGHQVTYSIAGLVRQPQLPCTIITGGFSQYNQRTDSNPDKQPPWQDRVKTLSEESTRGLISYMHNHAIDLLVDATHPYAYQISHNARIACQRSGLPYWQYVRPAWHTSGSLPFNEVRNWDELKQQLAHYIRPVFTIGQQPLQDPCVMNHQHWLVRTAIKAPCNHPQVTQVTQIGPFSEAHEEQMLRMHDADLLVSKNSGGSIMDHKLHAAHKLGIPIILLKRPSMAADGDIFHETGDILQALNRLLSC